jgi:hypothetical protein
LDLLIVITLAAAVSVVFAIDDANRRVRPIQKS